MRRLLVWLIVGWATAGALLGAESLQQQRVAQVAAIKGLVAFWDFALMKDGAWTSYHDKHVVDQGYPVYLRRIGDPRSYSPQDWPYEDEASKLIHESSGPFGHAVRFNKGYIFAEVPRSTFDQSPLDIRGRQPFTLIAWVKFIGERHLVAGIWDEGGWNKYGGRRQIALFGGLFNSKGVIAHISSTGAASYPQSTVPGSQYARSRAIDGRSFENGQWVAMAMTFNPEKDAVVAYCDGVATPTRIVDPVAQDVFKYEKPVASNPFRFPWPIYSPRSFVLKFNGYARSTGVYEHWLTVDIQKNTVTYGRSCPADTQVQRNGRVTFDVKRNGTSLLEKPLVFPAQDKAGIALPQSLQIQPGDQVVTRLHVEEHGDWRLVGAEIQYTIRDGAPFTFGRALGLGKESIDHGTQLFIGGVAVFNRVLRETELQRLCFSSPSVK